MSDETPGNVVSIATRKPFVHSEPSKPEDVDKRSAELLRELANRFEEGELKGVLVIAWDPELIGFQIMTQLPPGLPASEAAYRFLGGLEEAKIPMMDLATLGVEGLEAVEDDE